MLKCISAVMTRCFKMQQKGLFTAAELSWVRQRYVEDVGGVLSGITRQFKTFCVCIHQYDWRIEMMV